MREFKKKSSSVQYVAQHYLIKKKLGEGAFGKIYLAKNEKDNKEYAVKLESRKCKYP